MAAAALPGVLVALLTGVSGVTTFVEARPLLLAPQTASVAEAAGNRDAAEVIRRLRQGEDVNRPTEVRIPQRFDHPLTLTPLEAAVASERPYMVRLVLDNGATLNPPILRRIRCFAQRRGDRGTIAYLNSLDGSPLDCSGVAIPE
jgi:hypothetical protein